jgi:hypothetical protein
LENIDDVVKIIYDLIACKCTSVYFIPTERLLYAIELIENFEAFELDFV